MEVSIFNKPEVSKLLNRFVELRLHTDDPDAARAEEFRNYQWKLVNNPATPYYVIIDPDAPERPLAEFPRADLPFGSDFRKFLEDYLAERN